MPSTRPAHHLPTPGLCRNAFVCCHPWSVADLEHIFHLLHIHCFGSSSKGDAHLCSSLAAAAPSIICREVLQEAISLFSRLCRVIKQGAGCPLGHHQEGLQWRGGHVWGWRHLVQRELPPSAKTGQEHACSRQAGGSLPEDLVQEDAQLYTAIN